MQGGLEVNEAVCVAFLDADGLLHHLPVVLDPDLVHRVVHRVAISVPIDIRRQVQVLDVALEAPAHVVALSVVRGHQAAVELVRSGSAVEDHVDHVGTRLAVDRVVDHLHERVPVAVGLVGAEDIEERRGELRVVRTVDPAAPLGEVAPELAVDTGGLQGLLIVRQDVVVAFDERVAQPVDIIPDLRVVERQGIDLQLTPDGAGHVAAEQVLHHANRGGFLGVDAHHGEDEALHLARLGKVPDSLVHDAAGRGHPVHVLLEAQARVGRHVERLVDHVELAEDGYGSGVRSLGSRLHRGGCVGQNWEVFDDEIQDLIDAGGAHLAEHQIGAGVPLELPDDLAHVVDVGRDVGLLGGHASAHEGLGDLAAHLVHLVDGLVEAELLLEEVAADQAVLVAVDIALVIGEPADEVSGPRVPENAMVLLGEALAVLVGEARDR